MLLARGPHWDPLDENTGREVKLWGERRHIVRGWDRFLWHGVKDTKWRSSSGKWQGSAPPGRLEEHTWEERKLKWDFIRKWSRMWSNTWQALTAREQKWILSLSNFGQFRECSWDQNTTCFYFLLIKHSFTFRNHGHLTKWMWSIMIMYACTCAKLLQSCLTLCNPLDCNSSSSSVRGILQARILEWVDMPSFRGSHWPRDKTHISYVSWIGRWVLYH